MRVTIAAVGRLKAGAEREIFSRYWKRLEAGGRQQSIGPLKLIETGESTRGSPSERRNAESAALLKKIDASATLVALDESGKALTSQALAKQLERYRDRGTRELVFVIGGADGHGKEVSDRAALKLALGPMTLPHGLARIVLAEQLYRAATMLSGHPYHRA